MSNNHKIDNKNTIKTPNNSASSAKATTNTASDLNDMETLSQYIKSVRGTRQAPSIPPLAEWHPAQVVDMDLTITANGDWWHEGSLVTRQSLVDLFATVLCKEERGDKVEYFLKTPTQKLRIHVEDVPLLINDVGIVTENGLSWLEFSTTTGDVVRLDQQHTLELRPFFANNEVNAASAPLQFRPYMLVRDNLEALIGRNTFYHLIQIGTLTEHQGHTVLTLQSGGQDYQLSMPDE